MTEECNDDGGVSLLGPSCSPIAIDETKLGGSIYTSMLWVSYLVRCRSCCCPFPHYTIVRGFGEDHSESHLLFAEDTIKTKSASPLSYDKPAECNPQGTRKSSSSHAENASRHRSVHRIVFKPY